MQRQKARILTVLKSASGKHAADRISLVKHPSRPESPIACADLAADRGLLRQGAHALKWLLSLNAL
jgi:hypothetical protein